jgi:hypothetical protein
VLGIKGTIDTCRVGRRRNTIPGRGSSMFKGMLKTDKTWEVQRIIAFCIFRVGGGAE